MKIVTLGVDLEQTAATRFAAAMKGEAQGSFITFASAALLFQTLTEPRWQILRAMTGAGPQSLQEVAQRVGRDAETVQDDVRALLDTGVLERTADDALVFPYDAVHVDFTLTATDNSPEAASDAFQRMQKISREVGDRFKADIRNMGFDNEVRDPWQQ